MVNVPKQQVVVVVTTHRLLTKSNAGRKSRGVLGQEGSQMVKGISSTSSLPFQEAFSQGKPCCWHSRWEQRCRQLQKGLSGTKGCVCRAWLCLGVGKNCNAAPLQDVEAFPFSPR